MDLLILCGGKATRLQGVNNDVPKCLLKVQGASILGTLINQLHCHCTKVIVSYAGNNHYYNDILNDEINHHDRNKIVTALDPHQQGTANAVQYHTHDIDGDVCVINGDTLFTNYASLLPRANPNCDVVFSTSFQSIGRSTQINNNLRSGKFDFKKNRFGNDDTKGNVTNGVVYLSKNAVKWLQKASFSEGESLEENLLSSVRKSGLAFGMHESNAQFIDFGTPAEYLNPDKCLLSLKHTRDR